MRYFDLACCATWEFDKEFLRLVEQAALSKGKTVYLVGRHNLQETFENVKKHSLRFGTVLDRASDEDEGFLHFVRHLQHQHDTSAECPNVRFINPLEFVRIASDKATMHTEFLERGIEVPFSIIIQPYSHKHEVELSISELARLGRSFIIKPANTTGGGVGVVLGAESLKDVLDARQHHKNDKYLLQETIKPAYLGRNRAWFRVFYAFGEIMPCWWDDLTHAYDEVTPEEETMFSLGALRTITAEIQKICKLDFFSTEIAYSISQKFVTIDYVNEICDMRLQSVHPDGVPDRLVHRIAELIVDFAASPQS